MSHDNNWKVEFQRASGEPVFTAEGYKSPLTMDIVTEDSFVHLGLVQMSHRDEGTQSMGCDVVPLMDTWEKALVNADVFGLKDIEVARRDYTENAINEARNQAYLERRNSGPDIAGDVFG